MRMATFPRSNVNRPLPSRPAPNTGAVRSGAIRVNGGIKLGGSRNVASVSRPTSKPQTTSQQRSSIAQPKPTNRSTQPPRSAQRAQSQGRSRDSVQLVVDDDPYKGLGPSGSSVPSRSADPVITRQQRRSKSTPVSSHASEHTQRRRIELEESTPPGQDIDEGEPEDGDDYEDYADEDPEVDADDLDDDDLDDEGIDDETEEQRDRREKREADRNAVVKISEQTGMPLARVRRFRRHFGSKAGSIIRLLTDDDHDGAETLIYQTILMSIIDMIPAVEKAVHKAKGTRNVYQYNQLVSQLRETMADVQARRDRGRVGQIVVEKHVRPAMLNSAQQMVLAVSQLLAAFPFKSQKDRTEFSHKIVTPLQRELANFLNEQIIKLAQDVSQELS